jgi:hypothetical protein
MRSSDVMIDEQLLAAAAAAAAAAATAATVGSSRRMRANEEPEQGRAEQRAAGGARGESDDEALLVLLLLLSYPGCPLHTTHQDKTKGGVRVLSLVVSPTAGAPEEIVGAMPRGCNKPSHNKMPMDFSSKTLAQTVWTFEHPFEKIRSSE